MNNFIFDPSYRKEERLDFRLWIFRSNIPRPLEARRPPVRWHCKNQRLTPKIRKKWKWNRTLQLFASTAAGKQLNKLWEKTSSTEENGNGKLKVKRDLFELFLGFCQSLIHNFLHSSLYFQEWWYLRHSGDPWRTNSGGGLPWSGPAFSCGTLDF